MQTAAIHYLAGLSSDDVYDLWALLTARRDDLFDQGEDTTDIDDTIDDIAGYMLTH